MSNNRRYKSPILHRLRSEQQDEQNQKSPNVYTQQFQKTNPQREDTFRKSIGRSKQKKNFQKISHSDNQSQNQRIKMLMKENSQLRKQIVELKVHQFYQFDDKKLKQLLVQVEFLKKELKKCKQQLQQYEIQNDYLRRTNTQMRTELQKSQQTKVYTKKYPQNNKNRGDVSPRIHREDQQLTQRINKRPIISSSNKYDDFQDCRVLLEVKSLAKKQKYKKSKDIQNEYLLLLQSKQRLINPTSPRNSTKPYTPTSPRDTKNLLTYKSRKNNINQTQL